MFLVDRYDVDGLPVEDFFRSVVVVWEPYVAAEPAIVLVDGTVFLAWKLAAHGLRKAISDGCKTEIVTILVSVGGGDEVGCEGEECR